MAISTELRGFDRLGKWRRLRFESLEERRLLAIDAAMGPTAWVAADEPGSRDQDADGLARFSTEQELTDYLLQAARARWQYLFGQPGWGGSYHGLRDELFVAVAALDANLEISNYSGTNVQVDGVDEGDLVETDGDYIYLLRGQDLLILDARPAAEMQLVSQTRLADSPLSIYLLGDRLIVISDHHEANAPGRMGMFALTMYRQAAEVAVTVFDVSDRTLPAAVRQTVLEGNYVTSRMIEDRLVLVLQNDFDLPPPEFLPDQVSEVEVSEVEGPEGEGPDVEEPATGVIQEDVASLTMLPWSPVGNGRYETEEEYVARVAKLLLNRALPNYYTTGPGGVEQTGLISTPTDVFRSVATTDWASLSSIVVLDATGAAEAPLQSASVPTNFANQVYMSHDNVYLIGHDWQDNQTSIYKFHIASDSVDLVATGAVSGRVLNQFSIDEHEGYLRIATTGGAMAGNHLFVLAQEGNELEIVGRLEGLAPGEIIYSVRFLGDLAYVVTFRQIDPLFAIDMSDPTQPRLGGELHIPGFSNYLQPVGENHLLGLGRDIDPLTGQNLGLQVSLFDVSNLNDPRLVERLNIDVGAWASSEAAYDHHAVSYFAESGILAIPVQGWDDRSWTGFASVWSQMLVFEVDTATGLSLVGQIDVEGTARRSVRIDDVLYSISTEMVIATPLADPATKLAVVDLPPADDEVEFPPIIWVENLPVTMPEIIDTVDEPPLPTPEFEPPEIEPPVFGPDPLPSAMPSDEPLKEAPVPTPEIDPPVFGPDPLPSIMPSDEPLNELPVAVEPFLEAESFDLNSLALAVTFAADPHAGVAPVAAAVEESIIVGDGSHEAAPSNSEAEQNSSAPVNEVEPEWSGTGDEQPDVNLAEWGPVLVSTLDDLDDLFSGHRHQ